jgi:hypothetical protein
VVDKHKMGPDGVRLDGIGARYPTPTEMQQYEDARNRVLAGFRVPTLLHRNDPLERLFVANFDGTGNDAGNDPEHLTNIGGLDRSLHELMAKDKRIHAQYVEGAGTQDGFLSRTLDGIRGHTYDARLQRMYAALAMQTEKWVRDDPDVRIRIITTGFSRGADQAAGFSRMVHDRGIRNVVSGELYRTSDELPVAEVLLDPVGKGVPHQRDRRLPPNSVSGFQVVARDERRDQFPSSQIVRQGLSEDGRYLGITLPGAHSDIGGSYHQNALSTLNYNLVVDLMNSYIEGGELRKLPIPTAPVMFAIHNSDEHQFVYTTDVFDKQGFRDTRGPQADAPSCRIIETCPPPEPLDPRLEPIVTSRHAVSAISDVSSQRAAADPKHPDHPDHRMHTAIGVLLGEEHAREGIDLTPAQLDRLTSHVLVDAKRQGLTAVTHLELGQDNKTGLANSNVSVFQAFRGDVDDPRTAWAHTDAMKGLVTPVETSNQQLQAVNQGLAQQSQQQQVRQEQHRAMGSSMSM